MKPTNKIFVFTLFVLVLNLISIACKKGENENKIYRCGITVNNNEIRSPQWLIDVIDQVKKRENFLQVTVYLIEHKAHEGHIWEHGDENYIAVFDLYNANNAVLPYLHFPDIGQLFFTCKGEPVSHLEDERVWYDISTEIVMLGNCTLLWESAKPEEQNECDNVVVTDRIAGEIESPQWLAHTVDTLAHRVPTYTRPISVWSRIYDGQEYITIYNPLESAFTRIFIFFTCTGNFVTPVTPFWMELFYAESSLLWGNHQYYEFNPNLL